MTMDVSHETPDSTENQEAQGETPEENPTGQSADAAPPLDNPTAPEDVEKTEQAKIPPIQYALGLAMTEGGGILFLNPKMGQKRNPSDEEVMTLLMQAQWVLQRNMIFGGIEGSISAAMQTATKIGAQTAADYLRGAAKGIIVPR